MRGHTNFTVVHSSLRGRQEGNEIGEKAIKGNPSVSVLFIYLFIYYLSSSKDVFPLLKRERSGEGGREGEGDREREKYPYDRETMIGCLLYMPDWGLNAQPFSIWDSPPTN